MMSQCPNCGKKITTSAGQCPHCSYRLSEGRLNELAGLNAESVPIKDSGGLPGWLKGALVVLGVLAVVGGIAVFAFYRAVNTYVEKSRAAGDHLQAQMEETAALGDRVNAQMEMARIHGALDEYSAINGAPPDSLGDLVKEGHFSTLPEDPWGNAYRYKKSDDGTIKLSSSGPDGVHGTDDDVFLDGE